MFRPPECLLGFYRRDRGQCIDLDGFLGFKDNGPPNILKGGEILQAVMTNAVVDSLVSTLT
jgi:hypothetical protein